MTTDSNYISVDNAQEVEVGQANHTWTSDSPTDVCGQVESFKENGFLVMKGLVSRAELAELDGELRRIVSEHKNLKPIREGFNTEKQEKWPDPNVPVFRKIGGIYDHSDAFRRLCAQPDVIRFLKEFYGSSIELYRDVVMMKQPHIGREKPWHQDAVYWGYEPNEFISAMVALDAATVDNGVLQVVPGSHKHGALSHQGAELQVELGSEQQERTTNVPMESGDILMFHSLTLHASEPNRSDHQRRMCIFSYMAPFFRFTGEGKEPERIPIHEVVLPS